MMEFKGYVAKVEFDDEAEIFYGELINLRDVITFEGESGRLPQIKSALLKMGRALLICQKNCLSRLKRRRGGKFVRGFGGL